MAAGDVFATTVTIAAGSFAYYQPAAGKEYLITTIAPRRDNVIWAYLYDGTQQGSISNAFINDSELPITWKVFVNNSMYFQFYNNHTGVTYALLSGIELK